MKIELLKTLSSRHKKGDILMVNGSYGQKLINDGLAIGIDEPAVPANALGDVEESTSPNSSTK